MNTIYNHKIKNAAQQNTYNNTLYIDNNVLSMQHNSVRNIYISSFKRSYRILGCEASRFLLTLKNIYIYMACDEADWKQVF